MSLLHLATGFKHSSIYKMMFNEMSKREIPFNVYIPKKTYTESSSEKQNLPYSIVTSPTLNKVDTLLYYPRVNKMVRGIEEKLSVESISFVHAHSLFSDGGVAYKLYKKYNIPYIVAVRDTDVSKYLKYGPHLKKLGYNILRNAQNIIFLSKPYKDMLFSKYFTKDNESLLSKSLVIPNGIDDFWHNKRKEIDIHQNDNHNQLIFVGKLIERKNPETVIKVAEKLNELKHSTHLKLVGDGDLRNNLEEKYADVDYIEFVGQVNDLEELWSHYITSDVLIVPSFTETFGLVYPEAMSTGTPVIYTENQGFDGVFKNGEVGYSVNPTDVNQIVEKTLNIIGNYEEIADNAKNGSVQFNWESIVDQYLALYKKGYEK